MSEDDVRERAVAHLASSSYQHCPCRFVDLEYLALLYRRDPDALRSAVAFPVEVDQPMHRHALGTRLSRALFRSWPLRREPSADRCRSHAGALARAQ